MPEDPQSIAMRHERDRRKVERLKLESQFRNDYGGMNPSQKAMRAQQFSYHIMKMVERFVPDACREDALHELMINAYENDLEIAQVPPERDAERAAALEAAALALNPTLIIRK